MQQNCKHSRGRCCLLQWFTEHKMLGQHAQAICALEKHFPTAMHVQHKTGTSDGQGQHANCILKDLQSEKFLKYLNIMMDVTNVLSTLSKTFHSDQLCITDMVTSLQIIFFCKPVLCQARDKVLPDIQSIWSDKNIFPHT